jgi:hypothetical protein
MTWRDGRRAGCSPPFAFAQKRPRDKAGEELERALGETLQNHNISIQEAFHGRVRRPPSPLPVPFLQIRDGYADSGAAPGKDTAWHDAPQAAPPSVRKEDLSKRK